MISIPLEGITSEFVNTLVQTKEPEGRDLDYKRDLPKVSLDSDKKEFLKDVSSFANAGGGLLLYGIDEERDEAGKPTGKPGEVLGVPGANLGQEILRLEQVLRSGLDPRLAPLPKFCEVSGLSTEPVLALQIFRSWLAPHMLRTDDSRFWIRGSAGKQHMDVREIRAAFVGAQDATERVKRFLQDRLGRIVVGDTPHPLSAGPRTVLHLIPLANAEEEYRFSPEVLSRSNGVSDPLEGYDRSGRFNFEGYVRHSTSADRTWGAYCQLFRSGAVELVDTWLLPHEGGDGRRIVSAPFFEQTGEILGRCLRYLRALGVHPPIFLSLALIGVRGCTVDVRKGFVIHEKEKFNRDFIALPEFMIEDLEMSPYEALKTAYDVLFQGSGHSRCTLYDEAGIWKSGQD